MSEQVESIMSEPLESKEPLHYDAIFRPILSGNAFEETIERLAQAVKLGVVAPGSKLPPERELVTRLQVSRATLREAIRVLEQSGYLEAQRGRSGGTFVVHRITKTSESEARSIAQKMGNSLLDALDFRWAIEPAVAELAALRAQPTTVAWLKSLLEDVRTVSASSYRQADSRFHLAIAEATGTQSLITAVADVQMRLSDLLATIPLLDTALHHSDQQHEKILDAIIACDGKRARIEMEEHVMATANLLRGFLG